MAKRCGDFGGRTRAGRPCRARVTDGPCHIHTAPGPNAAAFVEALKDSGGIFKNVAEALGVKRSAVDEAVNQWPEVREALAEEEAKVSDLVKERMIEQAAQGNVVALKWCVDNLPMAGLSRGHRLLVPLLPRRDGVLAARAEAGAGVMSGKAAAIDGRAKPHAHWDKVVSAAYLRMLGATQNEAARQVGRAARTIRSWESNVDLWRKARGEARDRWLQDATDASRAAVLNAIRKNDADLAKWILERVDDRLAPPKQRVEATGADGGPIEYRKVTDEELRRRATVAGNRVAAMLGAPSTNGKPPTNEKRNGRPN